MPAKPGPKPRPPHDRQASQLQIGINADDKVGLIPLNPAYGLALVIQLSLAALMFLRVASSLMAGHGSPGA